MDPLNQMSDREFWPVLTVARHRVMAVEGLTRGCFKRQLRTMEGILEAWCVAEERRKPVAIDISPGVYLDIPKTSDDSRLRYENSCSCGGNKANRKQVYLA